MLRDHIGILFCCICLCSPQAGAQSDKAVDTTTRTIRISLTTEPPSLNTLKATDNVSAQILEHLHEGLLRIDERNRLAPAIAERWEMNGSSVVFHLRSNARWSDGKPITAHDFVFAWRKVLEPATGAQYASILYPLKNAEAINKGQAPPQALGVHAVDDLTLEVELEHPTGYFPQLMPFFTFYPVREDFYKAQEGRYAADAGNMISSGPYVLTEWIHGASLRMEKNPWYWNSDDVNIEVIEIPHITPDTNAVFNLFRDGRLAIATNLDAGNLQSALDNRMRLRTTVGDALAFQTLNHREGRLTANLNFRRALQAAYDNEELVYRVMGIPGYKPAESLFPAWLLGVNDRFRVEYPAPGNQPDPETARHYLEQARQELGIEEFPNLVLLADDSPNTLLIAQYLQNTYKQVLGLDFRIDAQTFKQRLAKMRAGDFDITLASWYPDYEDPMTFADLFASWNEVNRGRFESEEYDRQVRIAQQATDRETRMRAMAEIQRIVHEQVVILPDYERVLSYVLHPQLSGVTFKATGGSPIFTYARISAPAVRSD